MTEKLPEPWLRGTLTEVPPVLRAVLHALELCSNDVCRFCEGLSDEELNTSPFGLPPVAFHLKHIARSTDRLLSYAEGRTLSDDQLAAKQSELDATSTRAGLFSELDAALKSSAVRIRGFSPSRLDEVRLVGKKQLPTTVAGLLVHVADHVQRHVGQAVTTSKIVLAQRR
jgi:uncharacterized damage-inducible protein DinB